MEIFNYRPDKDIIEIKVDGKIVRYSVYDTIYKKDNYRLCHFKKCWFNRFKEGHGGTSGDFESIFTNMSFNLYFEMDQHFPFKDEGRDKYITIINCSDGNYKFLNVDESIEFFDSIRMMNKLMGKD